MTDWQRTLDASTPWAALPAVVDRLVERTLDDSREQVAADATVTADERAAIVAKARPLVAAKTREAVEAAWTALQLEAHPRPM